MNLKKKIRERNLEMAQAGALGLSMRLRLFLFLMILVITMLLGVIVVLLLTGVFTAGLSTSEKLLANKLSHTWRNVSQQYGQLSVQAVELSKEVSKSMEHSLRERGLKVADLQDHPELLEQLLANEYQRALFSLYRSQSSGVFIILDATVNPKLKDAEDSRAGLFIKNMEPNILSSSSPNILLLRGFPDIGRRNAISLHSQWNMEFDISDAPYYHLPMEQAAQDVFLPLSRLYYWSPAVMLPGTSEEVMLCSVPLIDSQGNPFGVCGFEVSAMLFKLSYMPDNSRYTRLFSMLSPICKEGFTSCGAMFSGSYSARNVLMDQRPLHIEGTSSSFSKYKVEKGKTFVGFHRPVDLYPQDSAFQDQEWALALMLPEEDIKSVLAGYNRHLSVLFVFLAGLGIGTSVFLSRYYLKPIARGFALIKADELKKAPKTRVAEIDDLIGFLSEREEKFLQGKKEEELPAALQEFLSNLQALSPAERAVFKLYAQEHTAKEIAGILCLSINTIKTHTRRIYSKLNVSSREELLLYINMVKEAGEELK